MTAWYLSNVTTIQNTFIAALLALSIQVTMRSGTLSVAGIGFYGIGEYTVAILVIRHIADAAVATLVACGVATVLGLGLSLVLRRVRGLYLAMVTLAFVLVLNIVESNGGSLTGGPAGLFGVPLSVNTFEMLCVLLVAIVVCAITERGRAGRTAEALRIDELLAKSVGIKVHYRRDFDFVFSAVLGTLAGSLNVLNLGSVGPSDAGFALTVTALTAVVIGGRRSWLGALIGAMLVTWIPTFFEAISAWRDFAFGVLVVVTVTLFPEGILGVIGSIVNIVWPTRRTSAQVKVDHSETGKAVDPLHPTLRH